MSAAVEHLAGEYAGYVQHCTRCGAVLTDYRNAAWPIEQGEPSGFATGVRVVVAPGCTYITSGEPETAICVNPEAN